MYLPPNDRKLLKAMKTAQIQEDRFVVIDKSSLKIYHCKGYYSSDISAALDSDAVISASIDSSSFHACLDFLVSENLVIRLHSGNVYQVTHKGWSNSSIHTHDVLQALLTHVAFPSAVAFITTLITLFLTKGM